MIHKLNKYRNIIFETVLNSRQFFSLNIFIKNYKFLQLKSIIISILAISLFCIASEDKKAAIDNFLAKADTVNINSVDPFEDLYEESIIIGYDSASVVLKYMLGKVYYKKSDYFNASISFFQAEQLARKKQLDKYRILSFIELGLIFQKLKRYDKSLYYYFNALELNERTKRNSIKALIYIYISNVFREKGELEKTKVNLENALKIVNESNNPDLLADIYYHYGMLHKQENNYDIAFLNFNKSLNLRSFAAHTGSFYCYLEMGKIFSEKENYDNAEAEFIKALKNAMQLNENALIMLAYFELGKLEKRLLKYNKSEKYFIKAKKRALDSKYYSFAFDIYRELADIYSNTNELQKSTGEYSRMAELKDSLNKSIINIDATIVKDNYATEEKEEIIKSLEKASKSQKVQLSKQKHLLYILAGSMIIVVILLLIVYYEYIKNKK